MRGGFREQFRREMAVVGGGAAGDGAPSVRDDAVRDGRDRREPAVRAPPRDLVGLALSGGGIRSATFNLGLLQGLARLGVLDRADYVSTVSGGGYVGAWWTAFRARNEALFPDAPADGGEHPAVRHLREFSRFLSPRWGLLELETAQFFATLLTGMIPTVVAAFAVMALMLTATLMLGVRFDDFPRRDAALLLGGVTFLAQISSELAWLRRKEHRRVPAPSFVLGAVATSAAAGVLWWLARPHFGPTIRRLLLVDVLEAPRWGALAACAAGPAGVWLAVLVALALLQFAASRLATRERRIALSWLSRIAARLLSLVVAWVAFAAVWAGGLLLVAQHHGWRMPGLFGGGGVIAGLASMLVRQVLAREPNRAKNGGASAGRGLALVQALTYVALALVAAGVAAAVLVMLEHGVPPTAVLGGALGVIALFAVFFDATAMSPHTFYRTRLVRAYLGATARGQDSDGAGDGAGDRHGGRDRAGSAEGNRATDETPADDLALAAAAARPLHLVCCAANDLGSDPLETLGRGARSAVLSPVGLAVADAWASWDEVARPPGFGSAITASAAAFNSNMGSLSVQLGRAVTFLMSMMNLRLGLWLPHPRHAGGRSWLPGVRFFQEMFAQTTAGPRARWVHLSDGGHFENLGLYELVRRHCRLIVVSDCGADGDVAFDDVGNAIRRVREDFGAEIDLDLAPLRPRADGLSRQHAVVGSIRYAEGDVGRLVLFKPSMTGDEPDDVQQYRTRNGAFPHESTGDQFYDEAQWESYRRLGLHVAETCREDFARIEGASDLLAAASPTRAATAA